jgi:hypothetical protein
MVAMATTVNGLRSLCEAERTVEHGGSTVRYALGPKEHLGTDHMIQQCICSCHGYDEH